MISDEELLKLWKDPNFEGSFRGLKTFQSVLKLNLNIDVSTKRLHNILSAEPIFLIHQKRPKIKRRLSSQLWRISSNGLGSNVPF